MGSEWHRKTWGELATLEYGKGLRGYQEATGNFRVYGTNGPIGWHDKPLCPFPSVVVGRKGAYRGIHFSSKPFYVIDTAFYLNPVADFDIKWAYYELLTHDINSMDSGSAIPSTSRESFYRLPVWVPPLSEQRAIAHILGTLDDKIELNRQMNETLEAIAQAIFKSWFVDFDPVHAKADGRDPGLPKEIADLFPDSFENSELGKIPKGWKLNKLGDVIALAYGKALKASNRMPGNVPVYGSNGPVGLHNEALVKGPGIIVGRKGNPGMITWSSRDFYPIDTTFYVVPKTSLSSLFYLFYALKAQDLPSLSADSAVPGLNRNLAYMNQILVPLHKVLTSFDKHVSPLFERIDANEKESITLSTLRDTLLPKLLSGKFRVPDTEKLLMEAGL